MSTAMRQCELISIVFQVKTTAPQRYKVKPNLALIDPKSVAVVQVLLIPG